MNLDSNASIHISTHVSSMSDSPSLTQLVSTGLCRIGNVTTTDDRSVSSEESASTALIATFTSLLSLLIVVGNGLIIVSVTLVKKLRQPANYLIVSLALSDFLVGLVVLPFTIVYDILGEWVFGPIPCDIHVSFDVICCTASIMNLCMISIDRYLMITKPMTYPKKRTGKLMVILIVTAWTISCLIIIPALFGFTQNIKDEPGWIPLSPTYLIDASPSSSPSPLHGSASRLNTAKSLFDGNSSSYWEPSEINSTQGWHFALNLGNTFRLSTVAVQNSGDIAHDVLKYDLQEYHCGYNRSFWRSVNEIRLEPGIGVPQKSPLPNFEAKVLRFSIISTYNDSVLPRLSGFGLFGEKAHGKTCLISQEVWFTIYSTVGAFYLPLCVMLCMYWKIYREASKFNARHRLRSASYCGSQEWSSTITPPSTPDANGKSSQTPRFLLDTRGPNNNLAALSTMKISPGNLSEGYGTDSVEKLIQSESDAPVSAWRTDLTVIVTDENCQSVFDEDTVSSECDFLASEKEVRIHETSDDDQVKDVPTSGDSVKDKTETEFRFPEVPRRNKSESPSNGYLIMLDSSPRSRQRTRSAASFDGFARDRSRRSHSPLTLSNSSESTANGLSANHMRFPVINEDMSLSSTVSRKSASQNDVIKPPSPAGSELSSREGLYVARVPRLYTRASAVSLESKTKQEHRRKLSQPRLSIFSGSSLYTKSAKARNGLSVPVGQTANGYARHHNRNGVYSRQTSNDVMQAISRRRSTVFNQLRRRVSLATSRERMRNVKATRTLGIIVGAFTFCWLPFFIVTFLRPFVCVNPESQDCIPLWLVRLVLWLGYLNSALNPVIYIGFSPDLRETFRLLVCCKCTNVDRRLAQTELRQAYTQERRSSSCNRAQNTAESIM